MRRTLLPVLAIVAALGLAGCKTDDASGPTTGQVKEVVANVQAYTQKACGFVPTAATINQLLKAFGVKSIDGVVTVAQEVCALVTTKKSGRTKGPLKLKGVTIRGRFVR